MIIINCVLCGKERRFSSKSLVERYNKTGLCGECYHKNSPTGINANHYKRGYFIRSGYKFVLYPNHPNANNLGYVREHRLVMEKFLDRFLKPNEVVHHIDGNTLNNDLSNLKLTNQPEHCSQHMTKNRKCSLCDKKHIARGYCMEHYWEFFLKDHRRSGK